MEERQISAFGVRTDRKGNFGGGFVVEGECSAAVITFRAHEIAARRERRISTLGRSAAAFKNALKETLIVSSVVRATN